MVQLYVSQLRRLLDGDGAEIVTHGRGYELRLADGDVDAARFERLLDDARARARRSRCGAARRSPTSPTSRSPQPRSAGSTSCGCTRASWRSTRTSTPGRHAEVIGELDALVDEHPLRERLHAQRMLALYRCGRQAEALEAYRHARAIAGRAGRRRAGPRAAAAAGGDPRPGPGARPRRGAAARSAGRRRRGRHRTGARAP